MLENLINITIISTAVVAVILPVKRLFKHRLNADAHIAIWAFIFVDILMFSLLGNFHGPVPVRQFLPEAQSVEYVLSEDSAVGGQIDNAANNLGGQGAGGTQGSETGGSDNAAGVTGAETGDAAQSPNGVWQDMENVYTQGSNKVIVSTINVPGLGSVNISKTGETVILGIWGIGIAAMLGLQLVRYLRLKKSLADLPDCTDEETLRIYEECRELIGMKYSIPLKVGSESTMLVGLFSRPTIYIKETIPKSELRYVLTHELCHYKHVDICFNVIAAIFIAIFWYNPVMYIAFREFVCDVEARCDERAMKALGSHRQYAEVLVRSAAGQQGFVLASTSFLGGEKEVETRVKRIVFSGKRKKLTEVAVLMVILLLISSCMSVPSDRPGTKDTVNVRIVENMQIEVPHKWLDDMKPMSIEGYEDTYFEGKGDYYTYAVDGSFIGTEVVESTTPSSLIFNMPLERAYPDVARAGGQVFFDSQGEEVAAVFCTGILTNAEWMSLNFVPPSSHGYQYAANKPVVDDALIAERIDALIADLFSEEKGFDDIEKRNVPDIDVVEREEYKDFFIYGTDFVDEKDMRHIYSIGAMFDGTNAVVLAVKSSKMDDTDIIKTLATFKACDRTGIGGAAYSGIEEFEGAEGRRDLTEGEYVERAKIALEDVLEAYTHRNLPVDSAISGYSVAFADDYEYHAGDDAKPETQAGYKYYYDNAMWDVVYPHARVYRVEYDVTPLDARYYEGETHFEKLAVFAVNNYINPEDITEEMVAVAPDGRYDKVADFYFVGFIEDDARYFSDTDSRIYEMLEDWYYGVNPYSGALSVDYVGDALKVGKIVNSLPLHEYIDTSNGLFGEDAIKLQTAEEPYGLAITYTIPQTLPQVSDDMWFTPISPQMQDILDAPYNAYIADQIDWNINRLYQTIGNLDKITITIKFYDEQSTEDRIIPFTNIEHTTRDGFYNY